MTDNGKQFTARFGAGGEVLFDRICRDNGIAHRLTQPASPTTTGKVERFHQTLRRELLTDHPPFADVVAVQAAVDGWVHEYNIERPHQALDMAVPASRFLPAQDEAAVVEELVPLRLPAGLTRRRRPRRPTRTAATPASRGSRRSRGEAGRWRSTGWSRPAGTCSWPASSSGWAPLGRG